MSEAKAQPSRFEQPDKYPIVVEHLTKRFGSFMAVDDVSFYVNRVRSTVSRPQRRGEDHHHSDAPGVAEAHLGALPGSGV
jgi:hypothetical protein